MHVALFAVFACFLVVAQSQFVTNTTLYDYYFKNDVEKYNRFENKTFVILRGNDTQVDYISLSTLNTRFQDLKAQNLVPARLDVNLTEFDPNGDGVIYRNEFSQTLEKFMRNITVEQVGNQNILITVRPFIFSLAERWRGANCPRDKIAAFEDVKSWFNCEYQSIVGSSEEENPRLRRRSDVAKTDIDRKELLGNILLYSGIVAAVVGTILLTIPEAFIFGLVLVIFAGISGAWGGDALWEAYSAQR